MQKSLFFLLFSILLLGQKIETIDLSKSIKDDKKSIKNFTVIDQRTNPEIGSVMHHKDEVKVVFENGADKDLKDWFYKYNPVRGQNDMVLLLENLNISEDKKEKYSIGKLELRASTFMKKEDGYHFVYRKDTVATVSSRTTPYLGQNLARKVTLIFTDLLKKSYNATPWEYALSESELPDYTSVLKEKLSILKTDELKEGVYRDYYSFFTHNPEPGFTFQTNNKGIITKAVKGEEKTAIRHFYAFVYDGRAYKNIPVGYTEIFKNDQGVFIEVTKAELFPETAVTGVTIGAAAGGLVGGIIGAVIDASVSNKKNISSGVPVYIDPFTGNYIVPEDFGKTK
ncbi:hypothetical protein [Chryseobacterium indologenes]|uniref:hypothetical protein n=1 Tax=Chryseobacterium indologenes TaxID=253 RepID=UPI000BFCD062|nr:hypothetical protein [Chryseobacterium indologenes]ATN07165.1 hypothetical protein CRN76_18015 [Chryseobacterium indologenes]AYY84086.1 hypothetical protein EGX91_05765 [Chryseobacterium indologenes]MBF6646745.1 hypothetical protein [Chryseobacterium indologenes]MBU3047273.1 hypothetical protein [Chryseobacterium indologenes]QIX81037.1 hypothetical protein FOB56_07215 [Chryseobacterium indologenes]